MDINLHPPRKILITRTDRIGDVVLSTPAFAAVKQTFPDAHVAVMVVPPLQELVAGNPAVDEVIVYDKRGTHRSWWRTVQFARLLRRQQFDVAIHLHPTNRVHWLSYLARIPSRIGYRRKSGYLLTHAITDRKREGKRHEAEYNFDLLAYLHIPTPKALQLHVPLIPQARQALVEVWGQHSTGYHTQQPYLVINPSASCPSKQWSPERFAHAADLLAKEHQLDVVIIGGASDRPISAMVARAMQKDPIDLTGRLSLSMLAWVLKEARIVISNDSGPAHMAAAVGTPVVAIFGRSQPGLGPRRWRPLGPLSTYIHHDVGCKICLAHNCEIAFKCLDSISVAEVVEVAKRYEASLSC